MKSQIKFIQANIIFLLVVTNCLIARASDGSHTPGRLFATLPDSCPTPDAFVEAKNGDILLSCPNYASKVKPGMLLRLKPDGAVIELGVIPGVDGHSRPMGMAFDENDNLYVANNQSGGHGSILQVVFSDGLISGSKVIARGFSSPNGLRYKKGYLYVTQLRMPKVESANVVSGLYRIPVASNNLTVNSDLADPELIFHDTTNNPKHQFGLDGLVFSGDNLLYVANFGDARIYRLNISDSGDVEAVSLFAQLPSGVGVDGLDVDDQGNLYVAGFLLNQIYKVTPEGRVILMADYPDNNGDNGGIDQPADLLVYRDKLLISNFDLMAGEGIRNEGHGRPYTITYIPLL